MNFSDFLVKFHPWLSCKPIISLTFKFETLPEEKKLPKLISQEIASFFLHIQHNFLYTSPLFNPFPNDKLQISKLNEFADDNFKFDENARKLPKRVENTVGKGEIARYEQFLLFAQCFQKTCTADM